MENQEDTIRRLEAAIQQNQSTSTGGQAPPPNSDLESRLESISDRVKIIEVTLTNRIRYITE